MALHWLSSLVMGETTFKRVQTQFIAAAIDPVHGEGMLSSSGNGTSSWGIWRVDPGPRGVRLGDYPRLDRSGGKAPAGWQFDKGDWWLEEHGLIMEKPDFPLPPGKYEVTGGREVTTILTVHEDERWELADGAKLYDVTHLPCRAARYKPSEDGDGSPATADSGQFPVTPGGPMPPVRGCDKQVCTRIRASLRPAADATHVLTSSLSSRVAGLCRRLRHGHRGRQVERVFAVLGTASLVN